MANGFMMNPYAVDSNEYYSSTGTFDQTKDFIIFLSEKCTNEDEEYPLDEGILIIHVNEGVFIRSDSFDWSTLLTNMTKQISESTLNLKIIKQRQWDDITRNTRNPIDSFGDRKLAIWKVGF